MYTVQPHQGHSQPKQDGGHSSGQVRDGAEDTREVYNLIQGHSQSKQDRGHNSGQVRDDAEDTREAYTTSTKDILNMNRTENTIVANARLRSRTKSCRHKL